MRVFGDSPNTLSDRDCQPMILQLVMATPSNHATPGQALHE